MSCAPFPAILYAQIAGIGHAGLIEVFASRVFVLLAFVTELLPETVQAIFHRVEFVFDFRLRIGIAGIGFPGILIVFFGERFHHLDSSCYPVYHVVLLPLPPNDKYP